MSIHDPGESFEVALPPRTGDLQLRGVLSLTLFRCEVMPSTRTRPTHADIVEVEGFTYALKGGGVFKVGILNGAMTYRLANSAAGGFRGGFYYCNLYRTDDHVSGEDGNPINDASNLVEYVEPGAQPWRPAPIPD